MQKFSFTFYLVLLVTAAPLAWAGDNTVPHEIGGIRLGTNITDYPHIEYSNFLKEVVVSDWHGFDKGMISYGICDRPGEIIKVRFRYPETSKKFYDKLLKKYKKKLGKPDTWAGDAFGIHHVWKWTFKDEDGNRIELVLQHNLKDPKAPMGTVVTLSYPERIERERVCFNKTRRRNSHNADHSNCGPNCPMKRNDNQQYMVPK